MNNITTTTTTTAAAAAAAPPRASGVILPTFPNYLPRNTATSRPLNMSSFSTHNPLTDDELGVHLDYLDTLKNKKQSSIWANTHPIPFCNVTFLPFVKILLSELLSSFKGIRYSYDAREHAWVLVHGFPIQIDRFPSEQKSICLRKNICIISAVAKAKAKFPHNTSNPDTMFLQDDDENIITDEYGFYILNWESQSLRPRYPVSKATVRIFHCRELNDFTIAVSGGNDEGTLKEFITYKIREFFDSTACKLLFERLPYIMLVYGVDFAQNGQHWNHIVKYLLNELICRDISCFLGP